MLGKIGIVWSAVATVMVGNPDGRHCHWCEHRHLDDGEVTCGHPESKFRDSGRIRTWDGEECAKECGLFKIDPWYSEDANIRKSFSAEAAVSWEEASRLSTQSENQRGRNAPGSSDGVTGTGE